MAIVYKFIVLVSLFTAIGGLVSVAGLEEESCPYNCCEGDYGGTVKCHNDVVRIKRGYWIGTVPYDNATTVVGMCKFCRSFHDHEIGSFVKINVSDQCLAGRNESSVLCSMCNEGHYPAINSRTYQCLHESKCSQGILIYLASNIIGLFLLILFIFVFDFFPASGAINALVFFAQMTTTTLQIDVEGLVPPPKGTSHTDFITYTYLFINGIWKLDFAIPLHNVCLPKISNVVHMLLWKYLIALFPLVPVLVLLLIGKYIDKIKEVIIKQLRKLGRCVRKLIRQLRMLICKKEYSDVNIDNSPWIRCGCQDWSLSIFRFNRESSMQTLAASCLLLSFTKFSVTTFYLITPTTLYNINGTPYENVFYYEGHIPYNKFWNYSSIIAIFCLATIVVGLPMCLLLLRYEPIATTQNNGRSRNCKCGCWDSFVRCVDLFFLIPYQKDLRCGSNDNPCSKIKLWRKLSFGIHDCRWYAGWYFFLRLGLFAAFIFSMDFATQLITQQIILSLALGISVIVRPYKRKIHNRVDAFILLLIIIVNFTVFLQYYFIINRKQIYMYPVFYIQLFLIFIPPVMMTAYFFIKLYDNWCFNNGRRNEVGRDLETIDIEVIGIRGRINSFLCGCSNNNDGTATQIQLPQENINDEQQPLISRA